MVVTHQSCGGWLNCADTAAHSEFTSAQNVEHVMLGTAKLTGREGSERESLHEGVRIIDGGEVAPLTRAEDERAHPRVQDGAARCVDPAHHRDES